MLRTTLPNGCIITDKIANNSTTRFVVITDTEIINGNKVISRDF